MLHSSKKIVAPNGASIIVERHHYPSGNRYIGYWSAETFDLCIVAGRTFLSAKKAWVLSNSLVEKKDGSED